MEVVGVIKALRWYNLILVGKSPQLGMTTDGADGLEISSVMA